jgi:MarR family 2-MHQ and catechol resistance regulon transcriptional repressor
MKLLNIEAYMAKRINSSKREARALNTYVKLMRAAESLTARVHRNLSLAGLTVSQFGVIEALFHLGPLSQNEIGHKILRSSGNITMVIDNLEKRKLVKRKRNQVDRRSFIIHLTDAGQKLISDIFPSHAKLIADELNILTAKEQQILGNLCKKLGLKNED